MKKYDKSLVEVWGWRQKIHEELKGLTAEEYVKKVSEDVDVAFARYGIELKRVEPKKILQKTK